MSSIIDASVDLQRIADIAGSIGAPGMDLALALIRRRLGSQVRLSA
jgi:hypothetical protein